MHRCSKCGKGWGGLRTCHCWECCVTFSDVRAFDAHRKGARSGKCRTPESVGLVPNQFGYWNSSDLNFQ
ncbi:FDXHR family putative zinc-binding protein [Longispora fulva]|uniref:Phage FDXHR zinc binding domain-containing protein n=1 Tax=Longispora fulva TaxID=619741 RepID=A0A8J7KQJ8_9ACTN|nr:hypothetical protein [Longispora fulva]